MDIKNSSDSSPSLQGENKMKVSELILELQKIENPDATIYISCMSDFECLDFEVASDTSDNGYQDLIMNVYVEEMSDEESVTHRWGMNI